MTATAVSPPFTQSGTEEEEENEQFLLLAQQSPKGLLLQDHERDYTDDLEDLVRMQVTPQQLHTKKSHQTLLLDTFQAPLSPNSALSPTSPTQTQRSLIPRLNSSTSSRSPSPEISTVTTTKKQKKLERSGSISSNQSLSLSNSTSTSRIPVSSSGMIRGNSNTSSNGGFEGGEEREEQWETLQIAGGNSSPPNPSSSSSRNFPSTTPTPRKPRSLSTNTPDSRKRVQSLNKPSSSSSNSYSTTTTPSRKPYSNRTNYTPSPSSINHRSKKGSSSTTPPVRRKSMSTTREFSSYDLSSLPPEAFQPLPVPSSSSSKPSPNSPELLSESLVISSSSSPNSFKPLIYKNSKGELTHYGTEEDRIIPTVAKRLEAERLRKLIERGEGLEEGVVDEWGRDGSPLSLGRFEMRRRREEQEDRERANEDGQRREEEKTGDISENGTSAAVSNQGPTTATTQTSGQQAAATGGGGVVQEKEKQNQSKRETDQEMKDAGKAGCCSCIIC
ncbi:uncharacterized protein JCM6883_002513 [Sporobolomyces salmoneus]|uniref:uncharacterized protein n=1 Tax=Sporobolomyces salmoneus TaxID=183962 RepID=UPI00316DB21E